MKSVTILGATLISRSPDQFVVEALVVETVLDKMSATDGLQNATVTLDNVLNTDRLARIRAGEAIAQAGQ